jgi:molecular chaperone GrpE
MSGGGKQPKVRVTDKRRVRLDDDGEPVVEAASQPGEAQPDSAPDALASAVNEAAEYRELAQRVQAEFENYRKRVIREQTQAVERASEPLVRDLTEVLDEFELALIAAEKQPDLDRFLRGVEMVYAKLSDVLRAAGVERIEAEGKPFDPELHEALMHSEGEGGPLVADVLRPGYTMKGRVIRPAGVKVTGGD